MVKFAFSYGNWGAYHVRSRAPGPRASGPPWPPWPTGTANAANAARPASARRGRPRGTGAPVWRQHARRLEFEGGSQKEVWSCSHFENKYEYTYILYIYLYIYIYIYIFTTSSTAQGGGGSFKNRKPIGKVGCWEPGMTERSHWWSDRSPLFLSLTL